MNKVLIIGAGPSGLVLALSLTKQNIPVRIVDRAESKPSTSRALVIHARTLELYRQLGIAEAVVAAGHKIEASNIWISGAHRGTVRLGDAGTGLTPYPFLHVFPQDLHERLLEETLAARGVHVERHKELVGFVEKDSHVVARLRDTSSLDTASEEEYKAAFIVGCDGGHSAVRHACNIPFEGAACERLFYVADVEGSGPVFNGQAHVHFDGTDFMLMFSHAKNRARLNGAVKQSSLKASSGDGKPEVAYEDVVPVEMLSRMGVTIDKTHWFSTYHVHHRVAGSFRHGRAFLVGDAAHVHSPVGGQGMNTGIGDAINLAWKLAAVMRGAVDGHDAQERLLDSYSAERRTFAQTLVKTTDTAFDVLVDEGWTGWFLRTWIVPYVAPIVSQFAFFRMKAFRRMSQVLVNYRESGLAAGLAGSVHGGDRLPWVVVDGDDNHGKLEEVVWQVQVYGEATEDLRQWCEKKKIPLHVFAWNEAYAKAGLGRDAAYLIRPDTYVAVAEDSGLPERFERYFGDVGVIV
ncbi:putative FAD binding monooxygenase [Aspergillus campestris IBT 28561]|uniref:FAD binding monooxygenase n=1 Tax=Aspergillus campestris (strain IBT 28561) TaxID=1392248 RepID=A0A2I1CRU6_ASPC2|nr:putative FAD binding monooxygenase [Aspergillus campestris IBT 28561]PKY00335.1 putative FAD binding monooxygenase [Aspergillus campestris IBT 28561]